MGIGKVSKQLIYETNNGMPGLKKRNGCRTKLLLKSILPIRKQTDKRPHYKAYRKKHCVTAHFKLSIGYIIYLSCQMLNEKHL